MQTIEWRDEIQQCAKNARMWTVEGIDHHAECNVQELLVSVAGISVPRVRKHTGDITCSMLCTPTIHKSLVIVVETAYVK